MKKLGTVITKYFRGRHSNPMWLDFVPEETGEKPIPLPKTFYTRNDTMTKGGPLEGIPVNPKSDYGKLLIENGYRWNGKDWINPPK